MEVAMLAVYEIKIWTDAAKLTNMWVAGCRKRTTGGTGGLKWQCSTVVTFSSYHYHYSFCKVKLVVANTPSHDVEISSSLKLSKL